MSNFKILRNAFFMTILLCLMVFGLAYYGAGLFERTHTNPNSMSAADFIAELNQVQRKYSDKITALGNRLSDYNQRQYSPVTIATGNSDEVKALRKQLADMEIQLKDLISSMSVSVNIVDSSKTKLVHDTITPTKYQFVDTTGGHLKLQGYADVARQTLSYKYRYVAQYDIAQYRYRAHWWSKSEERIKLLSTDPNAEVSLKTFAIKQKRKRFALGLSVGYGATLYNGNIVLSPYFGAGVMAKLIEF